MQRTTNVDKGFGQMASISISVCAREMTSPRGIDPKPVHSALERWEIIEDGESGAAELKPVRRTVYLPEVLPWQSPRGHEVADDGCQVLSPTRKRLLWLLHRWRPRWGYKVWSGQFLGLLHGELLGEVLRELNYWEE